MIRIEEKYNFNSVDKKIIEANSIIERNIESIPKDQRGFLSQNILSQLRTFVEYIGLKIYLEYNELGQTIVYDDQTVSKSMLFIKGRGNLKYIERFHYFLQITKSHYVESDDGAERLMLKYYKYLVKLKITIKSKYGIGILSNINLFPIDLDKSFSAYYKEIAKVLEETEGDNPPKYKSGKYYVQKNKPFFIDEKIYYEVTLTVADDKSNKYDRMLAFTKEELLDNYSVKVAIKEEKINIFGKPTTINIIYAWNTSIRACEIINMNKIVGISKPNYQANDSEYNKTMEYMTKNNCSLYEIVTLDDNDYNELSQSIHGSNKSRTIFDLLDKCREYIRGKSKGSNVLKYLLYTMNNRIIKKQYVLRCIKGRSCHPLQNVVVKKTRLNSFIPASLYILFRLYFNNNPLRFRHAGADLPQHVLESLAGDGCGLPHRDDLRRGLNLADDLRKLFQREE